MHETTAALIIIAIFIVVFPLFWIAILLLISQLSGWARLANQYPAEGPVIGDTFRLCSARFGYFTNYGSCLNVTVSSTGIHMEPIVLFKMGHKPIFIHWNAVMELKRNNYWFFSSVQLRIEDKISGWSKKVTFYGGGLTESLEQHYRQN